MATLTGEVLGERTVLDFRNPGSHHVIHPHSSRTGYATGCQTQLQFNLKPTLEHEHNGIVNHPPRPPPVVIERLPAHHMTTHDRLERAALLARRDFRNGYIPAEFLSTEQSENSSEEESETSEASVPAVPIEPKGVQAVPSNMPAVLVAESNSHIKSREKEPGIDKMASEVVSLRRQLRRQVSRLREAVHDRKTSKMAIEDDEDIERELRREDGRSVRNMQSLYTLQQQVQKLKFELDKHQKVSTTVRDTKKSLAMKQLASTHRSAIRLLHSFAGMPGRPAVYQQLSELMQQLTLCCYQLGLDGTQLMELNDQMKALESEIVELNKNEEELATIARLRQVQPTSKPVRAPRPKQRQQYSNNIVTAQPNIRSGHFRAQTFSSRMRKRTPPVTRRSTKQPSPSWRKPKHHKALPKFTSAPPPIKLRPSALKRQPVKPTEAKQRSIPTYKKQKSKQKRKSPAKKQRSKQPNSYRDNEKVEEVLPLQLSGEDERASSLDVSDDSSCDSESSTEDVVSLMNSAAMKNCQLHSTSTPMPAVVPKPSSGHHDNNHSTISAPSNDEAPENLDMLQALQDMLVKITHIEEEKMRIQQRWNHFTYHDAGVKPVVCVSSPLPCPTMTLSASPSMLQSVSHYRDRFHHHLKLKGAITGLDWESSKLIEELSEEILDEVVDSTVSELDQLCEHYAHSIFASEFAVPNSNI